MGRIDEEATKTGDESTELGSAVVGCRELVDENKVVGNRELE